jgi:hypothetical protein
MAIMLAKTYQAFKAAGVPEQDAIAAAEEFAAYENRLIGIENRPGGMEVRLDHVENRLDHIESRLAVVESRIAALAGEVVALSGKSTYRPGLWVSTPRRQSQFWVSCCGRTVHSA